MISITLIITALSVGFFGSVHCLGMCGGIAGALGSVSGTPAGALQRAWQFNLGRICTYAILGALLAVLAGAVGPVLSLQSWSSWLRLFTAVMMLLIGINFWFPLPALQWLERGGSALWRRWVQPILSRKMAGNAGRFGIGLCWGSLPCGLVYTMLVTAAATGKPLSGAVVMLFFGLGTLPAMLGMASAAPQLMRLKQSPSARRWVGAALILFAIWTAAFALMHGAPGHAHHH